MTWVGRPTTGGTPVLLPIGYNPLPMKPLLLIPTFGLALFAGGCIQRTITVTSEPTGALVYLNDSEVGRTPVTVPFTFYGTYDVRVEKEGYQSLNTQQKTKAPWWEAPGPDLLAEAMPGTRRVQLKWNYTLTPSEEVAPDDLIERAKELRQQAE